MSKSPVYIGAGSNELAVQAALNIIQDGEDSASHLVTIADWVHLTDGTTVVDQTVTKTLEAMMERIARKNQMILGD